MQNFQSDKQRAIEELLNMNKKSSNTKSEIPLCNPNIERDNIKKGINIPLDTLIILGLIIILTEEQCDTLLILALLYILA